MEMKKGQALMALPVETSGLKAGREKGSGLFPWRENATCNYEAIELNHHSRVTGVAFKGSARQLTK